MENVAPIGAITRRTRQLLQLAFVVVAGGVFVAFLGLALYSVPLAVPANSIYPFYNFMRGMLLFGGTIIALIGLALAVRLYFVRPDNQLAAMTGHYLGQYLDERYWFVRNINKRGLGYIDAVLVGPPGALVFRIVDEEGDFRNDKGDWLKRNRQGEWMPAPVNPTHEAIVDIKALREYLARYNLGNVPVYGVVVFTKDPMLARIEVKEPVVLVSPLVTLYDTLHQPNQYMGRDDRIDPASIMQVVDLIFDR